MKYEKPHVTFSDQLQLLKSKNLKINNEEDVILFLSHVNYCKLSGYFKFFEKTPNDYGGLDIQSVFDLYYFDRELRHLLLRAIEKIEISIKTKIAYTIGKKYGAFGHIDPLNFYSEYDHKSFLKILKKEEKRSKEPYIEKYKEKYTSEEFTPIWMSVEILPLGTISVMYSNLLRSTQKEIAREYQTNMKNLKSWLVNITLLRNFCAHNSRIWNRTLKVLSIQSTGWGDKPYRWDKLAGTLYILKNLVCKVNPEYDFKGLIIHLKSYFEKYPDHLVEMGFSSIEDIDFLKK